MTIRILLTICLVIMSSLSLVAALQLQKSTRMLNSLTRQLQANQQTRSIVYKDTVVFGEPALLILFDTKTNKATAYELNNLLPRAI